MRLAVVSDVHGNLAALQAILEDLERQHVDQVVHGGDLVTTGPRPVEVLDRVRELGWGGVVGNTDAMLWDATARIEQERKAQTFRADINTLIISSIPSHRGRGSASARSGSTGCGNFLLSGGCTSCSCCMRAPLICGVRRCQTQTTRT